MNISFSASLTEIFEYPSFESVMNGDGKSDKGNIGNGIGSFGKSKVKITIFGRIINVYNWCGESPYQNDIKNANICNLGYFGPATGHPTLEFIFA